VVGPNGTAMKGITQFYKIEQRSTHIT